MGMNVVERFNLIIEILLIHSLDYPYAEEIVSIS